MIKSLTVHWQKAEDFSPLVFDSPHSGTLLPDHFRYACAPEDLMGLHDPHVEKLLAHIPDTGTPVLEALVHRTCIDLNRSVREIDPALISDGWPDETVDSGHVRQKMGLFPALAGPRGRRISPLYNNVAPLTQAEAQRRIENYYKPYYAVLDVLTAAAHRHHGPCLHVNMHSMARLPGIGMADIVLGDLDGRACDPRLSAFTAAMLEEKGYDVGWNGPDFAGGNLIAHTADPQSERSSLQIELARDLYLKPGGREIDTAKFGRLRHDLTDLARGLRHFLSVELACH